MITKLSEECELIAWRLLHARLALALEELLALKGDRAETDLVKLQHDLAELGQPPFGAKQNMPGSGE